METSYIYFAFSAVFNAFVSTFLGFLILFKDKKNKINRNLAWFSFGVALWSFAYILWPLSPNRELTLLSFQLLHVPACFVSIFYLHFVVNWLGIYKKQRLIIWVGYITSFFFASFTFTSAFIAGMVPKFSMRYWALPGTLYHYYLLMFFGLMIYASCLLIRYYHIETEVKRKQIMLVLVGIVLSFIGGSTNYFLWYNINIPPYGNILASSFVIFTVYAIVRYKLLHIKLIATEGTLLIFNTTLLFRFLVSRGTAELIVNLSVFAGSLIFSFILISSVKKEIQRREEVTKLAASLEKLNAQLKEADRQKTEFLSIASHQLRTPLSILKGYVELIEDEAYGKISKELRRVLNNINESNERLITLVDEFLNVSRIEMGRVQYNFQSCEIRDIVKSTLNEFADRANKKGIKLVFDGDRYKLSTFCDKEKVRLVFFNYIDNAIKYGNNTPLKISIREKDNGVAVCVADKGIGFSEADGQNLFSRYYRSSNTDRVGEVGYGLGLYVCRKFIEAQGGKVWAKSPGIGRGSEFGFWLPYKTGK